VREVMRPYVRVRIDLGAVPIPASRSPAGWLPVLAAITDARS
jgi:hypothetical protein